METCTSEIVCLQCGDVGFSNAYVYCVKCHKFVVHRYCLNAIPKSIDEFVLWLCDDCEADEKNQHYLLKNDPTSVCNTFQRDSAEEKRSANAVSIMRKDHYTISNNSSDRPYKESTNFSFNEHAKLASDSTLLEDAKGIKASLKRENGMHHESDPETTSALPPFTLNSGSKGSSKKMTSDMPSSANLKDHKSLFPQDLKKQKRLDLGTLPTDINQSGEPKVTKDRSPESNQSYSFKGFQKDLTLSAEPVMESIWRGSFNIFNNEDDILEDMMAHLSISANQKVYNEARQFKPVLDFEMLPRAHVWPQSFEKSEFVCQNIALYFFPSERCERFYDDLVDEMVEEELALKAIVKTAELLVFPSTKLPLSYWRFKGKYYLWGVFRGKKKKAASGSASCIM